MKSILLKLLLAISIGLIAGEIAGVSTKITKYYVVNENYVSHEVGPDIFKKIESDYGQYTKKEFNFENCYFFGILIFSGILIIFLIPEFKKINNS